MQEDSSTDAKNLIWDTFSSWFNPFADFVLTPINYISWGLWFVPVYLFVTVFIPFLKKLSQSQNILILLAPIIILPLFVFIFQEYIEVSNLTRQVIFYSFWVYVGLLIKDIYKIPFRKKILPCIVIAVFGFAAMFFVHTTCNLNFNMHENKFPPTVLFLFYNVAMQAILFLFCTQINEVLKKFSAKKFWGFIFNTYRDYCYTVYLYHLFTFFFVLKFVQYLHLEKVFFGYPIITVIICLPFQIISSALIARIFCRIETIGRKRER